jgi:SAM-dependent methyltransferase
MSARREAAPAVPSEAAIWQDVEFGSYTADLPLWAELAKAAGGPVLELGAGSGRVSLHLAREGAEAIALDRDPELLAALERRAEGGDVKVETMHADLASPAQISPPAEPWLVIAPLHVIQTLEVGERLSLVGALRDLISPGAVLAVALVDESTLLRSGTAAAQILPDMRELDGWVYSSEPLWVQVDDAMLRVRRIRERVSPQGEMERSVHDELLHRVSPERFLLEAQEAGFAPKGTRVVRSGENEADSVVALLEAV